jgi:hypothetical protein
VSHQKRTLRRPVEKRSASHLATPRRQSFCVISAESETYSQPSQWPRV